MHAGVTTTVLSSAGTKDSPVADAAVFATAAFAPGFVQLESESLARRIVVMESDTNKLFSSFWKKKCN